MTNFSYFQMLAEAMNTAPTDWQWIGPHMSQRMFGITETRAKAYAERHGGVARKMDDLRNVERQAYGRVS